MSKNEQCKNCLRNRPDPLEDQTCCMGGMCEWEKVKRPFIVERPVILQYRMWLPLENFGMNGSHTSFSTQPDMNFKPVGLMFWDLPDDAVLEQCKVMNQEVVVCGHGKLPAKVFARAESYELLKKRCEDGEELFSEWIDAPPITPANRIYIILSSETGHFANTKAAFWGLARHQS